MLHKRSNTFLRWEAIKQLGPNAMCGWQSQKKPPHWLKLLFLRSGGFRLAPYSGKYHCGATSRRTASPHYLSRCPPSYKSNSPKQTGGGSDLCAHRADGTVNKCSQNYFWCLHGARLPNSFFCPALVIALPNTLSVSEPTDRSSSYTGLA